MPEYLSQQAIQRGLEEACSLIDFPYLL
ncbi:hypothetical protein EVA_19959, partial [gut metagenome]